MDLEQFDYAEVPYFEGYRCIGLFKEIIFNKEYDYFKLGNTPPHALELISAGRQKYVCEALLPVYVKAEYGQPVVNKQGTPVVLTSAEFSDEIDAIINDANGN